MDKTYTQQEVEELLKKQRYACADAFNIARGNEALDETMETLDMMRVIQNTKSPLPVNDKPIEKEMK